MKNKQLPMKTKVVFIILFLFVFNVSKIFAQCAMCRAAVESQVSDGGNLAAGLNAGILYLAAIPYIIMGTIAYFWYKASRKRKIGKRVKVNVVSK